MATINQAYDLERFAEQKPHLEVMGENKKVAASKKKRTRRQSALNVVVYLTLALVAMAIIGYNITCNVRMTELNKAIMDTQTEIDTLKSERIRLEAELGGKTSAEQVNNYAAENGMITADQNQTYYIAGSTEDQVAVADNGGWLKKLWGKIAGIFS